MKLVETDLPGCVIIEPQVFGDERGFFFESFNLDRLGAHGISPRFVQGNVSSSRRGVLRGLQDTVTPLVVAGAGFAVNIGLNFALVYGAGLGVAGSAIGTVIAQWGMAAFFLRFAVREAHRQLVEYLRPLGSRRRFTDGLLHAGAAVALGLLVVGALAVWLMVRRGTL